MQSVTSVVNLKDGTFFVLLKWNKDKRELGRHPGDFVLLKKNYEWIVKTSHTEIGHTPNDPPSLLFYYFNAKT